MVRVEKIPDNLQVIGTTRLLIKTRKALTPIVPPAIQGSAIIIGKPIL